MARSSPAFGLDSLLLIIALIAACTAVVRAAPPLGIPLSVLSAAALVRTAIRAGADRRGERRMNPFDKAIQFFVSVAIVIVVATPAIASAVLLTALCIACRVPPPLGLAVTIAAGVGAGYGAHRLVGVAIQEWGW